MLYFLISVCNYMYFITGIGCITLLWHALGLLFIFCTNYIISIIIFHNILPSEKLLAPLSSALFFIDLV